MKLAETVTFGGAALDRAAHLRGRSGEIDALLRRPDAEVLPVWRGKILLHTETKKLQSLASDHPCFENAIDPFVFLGFDENRPRFACDISAWEPVTDTETVGAFHDPSEQRHPDLPETSAFVELRANMAALDPREAELAATSKAVLEWHRAHPRCSKCGEKSEMAMSGWQRNCPVCSASHFPRTDPVVIMLITHGNSVLLGRSPGWPDGMYSLLAGFMEPGETIEAAVRREVLEEAGVAVGDVTYLASQPWPFPASLMIGCHGFALNVQLTIDHSEIEDAFWVSREDLMSSLSGNNPDLKPARKGSIARFLIENWLADRLD